MTYAVIIGRFQPFHFGHLDLVQEAYKYANHVVFVIGSHNAPRSIRNPWDSFFRQKIIENFLSDKTLGIDYSFVYINDSAYNFTDWVIDVEKKVNGLIENPNWQIFDGKKPKVYIVGHFKDDTSYYLNYFPNWELISVKNKEKMNSTDIRIALFENKKHFYFNSSPAMYLIDEWKQTLDFTELQEEYDFIINYKKKWEKSPYPPTFVTADSIVFCLGHVLLIKRKLNPGKNKFALPGGFIKHTETIENACIRELREETNIDVGDLQLRGSIKMEHCFDHPLRDPRGRIITHGFMFDLTDKKLPSIQGGDDAKDAFWFPLSKIEENENQFFNDHAQIIKYFLNRMK